MTIAKMMKRRKIPDADTLQSDPGFNKILELDFNDMIPFVFSNIRKRGFFPLLYLACNTAALLFMIFYIALNTGEGALSGGKIIGQIITGIVAGSILVIPPHEMLHGLAYRILGARQIRFGMDLHQFIFYVTADRFPISRNELVFLALTPFIAINISAIVITSLWAHQLTLFTSTLLLSHNTMCIGDFAMIAYAFSRKGELITYDDPQKKRSYFYEKSGKTL